MRTFCKLFLIILAGNLLPVFVLADTGKSICSPVDYTVLTVNGVFTDEDEAIRNKQSLELILDPELDGESVGVNFLWNPSHLGGIGDILKSVEQGFFDTETITDYDLVEMLNDASQKVTTQKILLVAHSQGNFYANSFYDTVVDKDGGVPEESIGVYGVATPASRVAGGGKYLTSDNDTVIAKVVGRLPFRKILPPNINIAEKADDDSWGHGFSQTYLKYQGARIVSDIENALGQLKSNSISNLSKPCLEPPKISLVHKVEGAVFAVVDPVLDAGKTVTLATASGVYKGGVFVLKAGIWTFGVAAKFGNFVAETTWRGFVFAYQTGELVSSVSASTVNKLVGNVYSAVNNFNNSNRNLAGNTASVVLALNQNQPEVSESELSDRDKRLVEEALAFGLAGGSGEVVAVVVGGEAAPSVAEGAADDGLNPTNQFDSNGLRIVFVGPNYAGFGGSGGGRAPQVPPAAPVDSAVATTTTVAEKIIIPTPVLEIGQCQNSLASDGCLLATTTLLFTWSEVPEAEYYALNQGGHYSTTTELFAEVIASDFADYLFGVSAVGEDDNYSATSTQTVSVATIPIAINEIAWMGTIASANDEWLELKNNTDYSIDLSQWEIQTDDSAPAIKLTGVILPHEYLVFERTDDNTISDILAFQVYTGSLSNNGEQLFLSYASTTLDRTPEISSGAWAGGSNGSPTTRKTMERYASKENGADPGNWGSNLEFIENGLDASGNLINGTPGERNSVSYLINKGKKVVEDLTLSAEGDENLYVVTDSITVSASSTLSVESGVVIKFRETAYDRASLYVVGQLKVMGTEEDPVVFESFTGKQAGGINLTASPGEVGTSTITHARIENTRGVALFDGKPIAISETDFVGNYYGVQSYGGGVVEIENSNFASTTREAISVYSAGSVSVASSTIDNTFIKEAVGIYGGSTISFSSSTISNTQSRDAIGVYSSNLSLASTTIEGVTNGYGIASYRSKVTLENSSVSDVSSKTGVYSYRSGLSLASSTISGISGGSGIEAYQSEVLIENSIIKDISQGNGIEVYNTSLVLASSSISNIADDDAVLISDSVVEISNSTISDGGIDGVGIYGGTVTIKDSKITGFDDGAGVVVDAPEEPVIILDTEITGNEIGVFADDEDSIVIEPESSVHGNGAGPTDDIVVL